MLRCVKSVNIIFEKKTLITCLLDTPHVFIPPINTTVFEGNGVVTMHCVARGNPTTASYIWYQGPDRVLINQETDTIKIEDNGSRLRFFNPSRSLSTKYWCAGRNELGTGVPKGAYLNVTCMLNLGSSY